VWWIVQKRSEGVGGYNYLAVHVDPPLRVLELADEVRAVGQRLGPKAELRQRVNRPEENRSICQVGACGLEPPSGPFAVQVELLEARVEVPGLGGVVLLHEAPMIVCGNELVLLVLPGALDDGVVVGVVKVLIGVRRREPVRELGATLRKKPDGLRPVDFLVRDGGRGRRQPPEAPESPLGHA
jgi:hypothetical protein